MIKLGKFNKDSFRHFMKMMLLIDDTVFFTVSDTDVKTSMFTVAKDTVLVYSVPSDTMFSSVPSGTEGIRVGIYKNWASKLNKFLDGFIDASCEISMKTIADRTSGLIYAQEIIIDDGKLKMKIPCVDPNVKPFIEMTKAQEERVFNDTNDIYEYDLDSNTLKTLVKLSTNISDENALIDIKCDGNSVIATTDMFEYILHNNVNKKTVIASDNKSQVFKKFFDRIPILEYNIKVFSTKMLMEDVNGNMKFAINLAIQA